MRTSQRSAPSEVCLVPEPSNNRILRRVLDAAGIPRLELIENGAVRTTGKGAWDAVRGGAGSSRPGQLSPRQGPQGG